MRTSTSVILNCYLCRPIADIVVCTFAIVGYQNDVCSTPIYRSDLQSLATLSIWEFYPTTSSCFLLCKPVLLMAWTFILLPAISMLCWLETSPLTGCSIQPGDQGPGTHGPKVAYTLHVHTGVSNCWTGMWTRMIEWTREWTTVEPLLKDSPN